MTDMIFEPERLAPGYNIGDYDRRPWGAWFVIDVTDPENGGSGYCEKIIVVDPGKILSLQSHDLRHETWTVLEGRLTAIIDDERFTLEAGQKIDVPVGAIHCMANLGSKPCIVKEKQTGICREEDITRYLDAYGRVTEGSSKRAEDSVELYLATMEQMKQGQENYA